MKKAILVSAALALSLIMTSCGTVNPPPSTPDVGGDTHTEAPQVEDSSEQLPGEKKTLTEFSAIEIDVLAADIRVVAGDEWSVSYHLSDKEPLKQIGVEGDTLYVETAFDPTEYYDRQENWFVVVTVPAGTALTDLELETISGNVEIQGFSCDKAQLSSITGEIQVADLDAKELELETASGKIDAKKISAASLEAETISGNMDISGTLGELETKTVTGETRISGSISVEGMIESASGNISLSVDHPANILATSIETITLNDACWKGKVHSGEGVPVTIDSISGKIDVKTAG